MPRAWTRSRISSRLGHLAHQLCVHHEERPWSPFGPEDPDHQAVLVLHLVLLPAAFASAYTFSPTLRSIATPQGDRPRARCGTAAGTDRRRRTGSLPSGPRHRDRTGPADASGERLRVDRDLPKAPDLVVTVGSYERRLTGREPIHTARDQLIGFEPRDALATVPVGVAQQLDLDLRHDLHIGG